MLQAAGLGTEGVVGCARLMGMASVYASVMRTWLEDDDPGQARTMAALDRRLRRGERTLANLDEMLSWCRRFAGLWTPRPRPPEPAPSGNGAGAPTGGTPL
jgi:hypothetical protein